MLPTPDRQSAKAQLEALYAGRRPERVPMGSGGLGSRFKIVAAGHSMAEFYRNPTLSFQDSLHTMETYGWNPYIDCPVHTVLAAWDFGGDVLLPRGDSNEPPMVRTCPVQSENDVDQLTLPDPRRAGRISQAIQVGRRQAAAGLPVTFFTRSPFTMAANLCGLETFLRWTVKKPPLCQRLLELATAHIFNALEYWQACLGSQPLFVWMSSPSESNQLISPRMFERLALPWHEHYHRRLKAAGNLRFGFHICGDQVRNLPALAQAHLWPHPSILSFGHEVDLEKAADFFPRDIIYGNIEPAIIQTGTPAQIYELCRIAIAKGKKAPSGFILGPGCEMPVYAPPENVRAMTAAIEDLGRY